MEEYTVFAPIDGAVRDYLSATSASVLVSVFMTVCVCVCLCPHTRIYPLSLNAAFLFFTLVQTPYRSTALRSVTLCLSCRM